MLSACTSFKTASLKALSDLLSITAIIMTTLHTVSFYGKLQTMESALSGLAIIVFKLALFTNGGTVTAFLF